MNIKQAHYIQTIVQEGSITAAAKKLYVSQPSLSQMVRQIERELGVTLFERSTLPIRLTYAGRKYVECAHTMLVANERLENQLQEIRQENSGHLRLGISVQRGMRILPLVMPDFKVRYPNVSLELHEAGSARMEDLLRFGEIDLAFAAIESASARFDYKLIERETTGILAGIGTEFARKHVPGTLVTLESAANEQFVCLKQGHSIRVVQDQLFRIHAMEPRILMEVDSLEMAKRITVACGACMLCPDIYFDETVRRDGAFYPLKGYRNNRHFYACWRKGEELPKYALDLIDIIAEALKRNRTWVK